MLHSGPVSKLGCRGYETNSRALPNIHINITQVGPLKIVIKKKKHL